MHPRSTYRTRITFTCDLDQTGFDAQRNELYLSGTALIPPTLQAQAKKDGQSMPEGVYGFYGSSAAQAIMEELRYHNRHRTSSAPLWDLVADVALESQGLEPKSVPALMWRNPRNMRGAFLGVGRTAKETNDLLRFYTGDRYFVDRLALEPWRVDEYAAVMEQAYGEMRLLIFTAQMGDGRFETVARIYDPQVLASGLHPLNRYLSAEAGGEQPSRYNVPPGDWKGWGVPNTLSEDDIEDIQAFFHTPMEDKATRKQLKKARLKKLEEQGRFESRDDEIQALVEQRRTTTGSPADKV